MRNLDIYLDHAAATPIDTRVKEAMEPYLSENFYNPSAAYSKARLVKEHLNQARNQVARLIGAQSGEIVFTAGGTEANNLAVKGIMENYKEAEVLYSSIEHESVIAPAKTYRSKAVPVDSKGHIKTDVLAQMISSKTVLISIMLVNNELGTLQPIKDIANLVKKIRQERLNAGQQTPLFLHTDACQAPNCFLVNVARLGVDLMSLNGGKIYGPKQSGILFVKAGIKLEPLVLGGGQEGGMRSGTENVASIIGFAKALEIAQSEAKKHLEKMTKLNKKLRNGLIVSFGDGLRINSPIKKNSPASLSVTFYGQDNERLMFELDSRGITCSTASACSASKEDFSHVLKAIGIKEADARATLRFGFGRSNTSKDIDFLLANLRQIIHLPKR